MVDDLGTKVPWEAIGGFKPTALIETSPDNFQAWYVLDQVCRDRDKFEKLLIRPALSVIHAAYFTRAS
jgi:hypothetical protein